MTGLYDLARPFLFGLDPERAHHLALYALRAGMVPVRLPAPDPRLERTLLGLRFANPVGLAAGLDKDGTAVDGLLGLGFASVEVGSVTPRPQPGNPSPRLFRLVADRALINRYGFNNEGLPALVQQLGRRRTNSGLVGVNLGANKSSADRIADYVAGIGAVAGLADYVAINVSSPNTPGLRDLQEKPALAELLGRVIAVRREAAARTGRALPILLKLSPDLAEDALADIADVVVSSGIDGAIVSNTTLDRSGLTAQEARETGGLSGRPLFRRSTILLARFRKLVGPNFPLVGVGGIESAETAWQKLEAGADLVQVYTGMIFEGPWLIGDILRGLGQRLTRERLTSIAAIVGRKTDEWAKASP